jgi:hypothetical protein
VSLQAVRCVGFCYAAPALLDGTVPLAGPELAAKLARGTPDPPPIPVAAIAEIFVSSASTRSMNARSETSAPAPAVALNAIEIWELHNFTEDAHPIHRHQSFSIT